MDYNYSEDGLKIAEIISGGPLDKAHLQISEGDIITHIDGELVSKNKDWAIHLNQKANKRVLLSVTDAKGKILVRWWLNPYH